MAEERKHGAPYPPKECCVYDLSKSEDDPERKVPAVQCGGLTFAMRHIAGAVLAREYGTDWCSNWKALIYVFPKPEAFLKIAAFFKLSDGNPKYRITINGEEQDLKAVEPKEFDDNCRRAVNQKARQQNGVLGFPDLHSPTGVSAVLSTAVG